MRKIIKQWCAGKGVTTGSQGVKKKALLCYLAHFYGVNTPIKADFK